MSKPRYRWWGYVRNCIRAYPGLCEELENRHKWLKDPDGLSAARHTKPRRPTENRALTRIAREGLKGQEKKEFCAVQKAMEQTANRPDGLVHILLITLMYQRGYSMDEASLQCGISPATARRWHGIFVKSVARELGLMD